MVENKFWVLVGWIAAYAAALLAIGRADNLWLVGIWAAALVIGDLVRVATPSGNWQSVAPGLVMALVFLVEERWIVAAALLVSLVVSHSLRRLARSPSASLGSLARRAVGWSVLWASFDGLATTQSMAETSWLASDWGRLVAAGGAALCWFGIDAALRTVRVLGRRRLRYVWFTALADWPVVVGLFGAGVLFGMVYPHLGLWALLAAGLPYSFSHVAFGRYEGARRTYRQLISALSRIPEVAGLSPVGHAAGSAVLAADMARELGLHPDEVSEIEYGALLHDIGRITLNQAAPAWKQPTDAEVAEWSTEIVRELPNLERTWKMVQGTARPYRRPGEEADPEVEVGSQIIKVAGEFDRSIRSAGLRPVEALEVLYRGSAYDFDPEIVRLLRQILVNDGAHPLLAEPGLA